MESNNPGNHNNDVLVSHCKFNHCDASTGGSLFFSDGDESGDEETVIEYCLFDGDFSTASKKPRGDTGLIIHCCLYKLEISHSNFENYERDPLKYSLIEVHINEKNLHPNITNCTFSNNGNHFLEFELDKECYITFKNCKFTKNKGLIGMYYIQSNTATFEECSFYENVF